MCFSFSCGDADNAPFAEVPWCRRSKSSFIIILMVGLRPRRRCLWRGHSGMGLIFI
jgi:hypothetical protein